MLRPLARPQPATWLDLAASTSGQVTAPVLEVHLIPAGVNTLTGATTLGKTARTLARDPRRAGLVADMEPLSTGSENDTAWAVRPPGSEGGWQRTATEAFCGLFITATGEAAAYLSLSTDLFGALVDQTCRQGDLAQFLALVAPLVAPADGVTPAVRLTAAERVREGDPADVCSRSSGSIRSIRLETGLAITLEPSFYVQTGDLNHAGGDLASELAPRLLNEVRDIKAF